MKSIVANFAGGYRYLSILMNRVILDMSAEERVALAKDYFKQGYNCCQSVVMAFRDLCGVDGDTLQKLCVGLGGGVGRMREVCGCVCGMAVLSGFLPGHAQATGNQNADSQSRVHAQKTAAYTLTQKMAGEFQKETGSIVCRELLNISKSEISSVPDHRTPDYYRKRPCADMVSLAVRIVSEELKGLVDGATSI